MLVAPGSQVLVVLGANPVGAIVFTITAAIVTVLVQRMAIARDGFSRLAESEARFRALVQHSSDVILIVDPDGLIHYASRSAAEVFGEGSRRLTGRMLANPVHVDDLPVVRRFLSDVQNATDGPVVAEWRVRRRDGTWLWTENIGTNLMREASVRGVVVNARDISERRTLEARLTHEAFHDGLTNLANRALFLNRVSLALARISRAARETAVLYLHLA